MTWPTDKLGLINQQLAITGNNLVATANDGSDEWIVCDAAYEIGLEYALDQKNWKQLTMVAALTANPTAPTDPAFDTAYDKPPDCIHIVWVHVNFGGTLGASQPIQYQVLGNQIVVNLQGATNAQVLLKYVSANPVVNGVASPAPTQMLRTFMTALGRFVLAGIYRGLSEDPQQAGIEERTAKAMLDEAATRSDQEEPKRAPFNSRITASRRVRRPFPPTPTGWGGTGIPG